LKPKPKQKKEFRANPYIFKSSCKQGIEGRGGEGRGGKGRNQIILVSLENIRDYIRLSSDQVLILNTAERTGNWGKAINREAIKARAKIAAQMLDPALFLLVFRIVREAEGDDLAIPQKERGLAVSHPSYP